MTKIATTLALLGLLIMSYPVRKYVSDSVRATNMSRIETKQQVELTIPKLPDLLSEVAPKASPVSQTLVLEAKNTYVFRGPVTSGSVSDAIREMSKLSRNLSKTDVIYLVLDTPGGSVFDGLEFIDFLEGIPQEVQTVTIFAASMGFQFVQNNPGKRLITRSGTLMSHRATLGGIDGQLDGEFETRYRMIKRKVDYMEVVDAKRMDITLEQYKAKIINELWVHGFDAKEEKVADEMILLQCGKSLVGEDRLKIDTLFGSIVVYFDKCPLIKEPTKVEMPKFLDQKTELFLKSLTNDMTYNKRKFVKDIIVTDKFYKIFP